jgi:cytochrome c556
MEDYAEVAARAGAVADHPHVAPEEMQRLQGILNPEMSRFVAADQAVHDAAVRLRRTAEARQMDGDVQHLSEVQAGCVSCHTHFRERLRTDRP